MRTRLAGYLLLLTAPVAIGCGGSPAAPTPHFPEPTPPAFIAPPVPRLSVTRLMAFGDSFTEGVTRLVPLALVEPTQSYPYKLEAKLARRYTRQTITVANEGRGGERTSAGLTRLQQALDVSRPELVILLEGVNDLNTFGAARLSETIDALDRMAKLCLARQVAVILAGIPPQRPGASGARSAALVTPYNSGLRAVAQANGLAFVDIEAAFGGDLSLIGSDGLHPTAEGYERMAQAVYDRIVERYEVTGVTSGFRLRTSGFWPVTRDTGGGLEPEAWSREPVWLTPRVP